MKRSLEWFTEKGVPLSTFLRNNFLLGMNMLKIHENK